MITGGLGFVGSNLAYRLVELGSPVLLVDALLPDQGGNLFNVSAIRDQVHLRIADLRDASTMADLVPECEVIFNLAGQVSHIDSMRDPLADLEINCRGPLVLLEACRLHNGGVKVVYTSTRQIYGRPASLPVAETHLKQPTDVNGVNKMAGEWYHLVYNRVYGIRATSLRLTNTYGPRQLMMHNRQGFIPWFIRRALEGAEITLYGDGSQLRDLTFVDDAVEALLLAGANEAANGEVFNLGGVTPITLRDLAGRIVELAGGGSVRCVPWPSEKKPIDIGSFYADYSKIRRVLGWEPKVDVTEGLQRTIAYYRAHGRHYWPTVPEMARDHDPVPLRA
ncbi:MAG: NAD-dependent epimerase/dehydratase family protein [Chloroflexi bacterium]|nr:NAD-dependent epimerase/dehydratase family protein [Chloroflexota bacterium]